MPTTSAKDTTGSWFPSGYYGHIRNHPRTDFTCEYRQLAKPQPPRCFIARSMRRDARHPFSLHDNRYMFANEGCYFDEGKSAKKKYPAFSPQFNPDFCTWLPLREKIQQGLPHISTYQQDFTSTRDKVSQFLVENPPSSCLMQPADSTYHFQYGRRCEHALQINSLAGDTLHLTTAARERTAIRAPPRCLDTVASCLSWWRGGSRGGVDVGVGGCGVQKLPAVGGEAASGPDSASGCGMACAGYSTSTGCSTDASPAAAAACAAADPSKQQYET